jgi:hypothetical protein
MSKELGSDGVDLKDGSTSNLNASPNGVEEQPQNEANQPADGPAVDGQTEENKSPENPTQLDENGEPIQPTEEGQENNDEDEYEDVEIEEEEEIPEEEWEQMKEEILNRNPDDTTDPPRTRIVKKIVRRKKEIVESPQKPEDEFEDNPLVQFIKDKIELTSFSPEMWTKDHSRFAYNFITDPTQT